MSVILKEGNKGEQEAQKKKKKSKEKTQSERRKKSNVCKQTSLFR